MFKGLLCRQKKVRTVAVNCVRNPEDICSQICVVSRRVANQDGLRNCIHFIAKDRTCEYKWIGSSFLYQTLTSACTKNTASVAGRRERKWRVLSGLKDSYSLFLDSSCRSYVSHTV